MARLNVMAIEKIEKSRNSIQEEAAATYSTFIKDDEKYPQIDMYGSCERVFTEKVSQVIQLDKKNAESLIALLKKEFNIT